jgi:hypothetical protein
MIIWISRMNTLVTSQYQTRLSSIIKIFCRRIRQSDWNIQIKLDYFKIQNVNSHNYVFIRTCPALDTPCTSFLSHLTYLRRTNIKTNIKISALLLYILIILPKILKINFEIFRMTSACYVSKEHCYQWRILVSDILEIF